MSHFTVLVIGKELDELLDVMAPYDENLEVPEYVAMTLEQAREERLKQIARYEKYLEFPDEYDIERVERRIKELKNTDDKDYFTSQTKFYEEHDEEGNPVTTTNPNGYWDWWSVGGRWAGYFRLKDGKTGEKGDPGIFVDEKAVADPTRCDSALFGDIDWEAIRIAHLEELKDWWKRVAEEVEEKALCGKEAENYRNMRFDGDYKTEEEYVDANKDKWNVFYAAVTPDGEWHWAGKMGWFGQSNTTPDESDKWDREFWGRFLKDMDPDTRLTVLDCHI